MINIDIYNSENIDFVEFSNMQRDSFKELLSKMGVSDSFMTPDFYKWKYNSPFGQAKIVLAREDKKIVASTVNQALKIQHGELEFSAWQNGDSAMLPKYRGQGLYNKCVKKAVESLEENEIIYGFPNKNSIRGFSSHVTMDKGIIPLLASSSLFPFWASGKHITLIKSFSQIDYNFKAFRNFNTVSILKNKEYLSWRYENHPLNSYVSYFYNNIDNNEQAVVVTRKAVIDGKKVLVIMELLGTSLKAMSKVLGYAISKQRTGLATLMFNNSFTFFEALYLGFIKVPHQLLPKTQILFADAKGKDAKAVLNLPWQIQMGDWDGF
ncbi:MAG: GNAT family N-acetyltransferase [Deltaproteobacteria bacterium]|nr:GNAT family N-acetyltransferase [Deltaproteobacteria bacterium]